MQIIILHSQLNNSSGTVRQTLEIKCIATMQIIIFHFQFSILNY